MLKDYLDIILFTTFLLVNLIVGLIAGRRVRSLRDFSISNKDFTTATVTSTIVATWFGGGFIFYGLQNAYTSGLQYIIPLLGSSLCLLFTGQVLAVRMGEFLNNLSVAEAMGNLFNRLVRIITAISGILGGIGYIAIQFQVIAKMLNFLLGFEGPWVTVAAASIVILYSAFGGIRSVIITDLLQFIVFSIFIPILALVVWNHLKKPGQVAHTLVTNPVFNFKEMLGWNPKFLSALGLVLYFAIPGITPAIFQRVTISKDLRQVKDSFTYAAASSLLMVASLAWIAILLLSDNPNLESGSLVNYIITTYAYPGLKGLIAIGITAMAMSTADSYLNSSAVLAVNDILKPLQLYWKDSIKIVRVFSFVLGIFALLLALRSTDLLQLMLLSGSFYMPIVTVPLLLAIFGFRSSSRSVLIGMSAGCITVILWNKFLTHTGMQSLIPGMIANLVFYVGSHYILRQQGGWIGIRDREPLLAARQGRREAWQKFIYKVRHPQIYTYLQKNLPAYEVVYTLFAIYVIGATYASFYTIPESTVANYQKLYDVAAHSVLVMTAGFLTYPAWPPTFKAKWFITFAWPAGILYILFIVGTILVLMSGFHEVQVMIFLINLIMTAFLLSWPLMVFVSLVGIIIGCLVFYMHCGDLYACTSSTGSGQFKVIYGILLFSSFLIALFRFKQSQTRLENKNVYLENIYKQLKDELSEILGYKETLVKELKEDELALFGTTAAAYMQQAIYRITDYVRLDVSQIKLDDIIVEIKDILKLKDFDGQSPQLSNKKYTKEESIYADADKIKQVLVDSICYIHKHNLSNKTIVIALEDAMLGHRVEHMKDYTRKLKAIKITITTQELLSSTSNRVYMFDQAPSISRMAGDGDRKALLNNARIIDAHYGYAELDKEDTHIYVLPINVREVRGKVMELLRAPAVASEEEVKHPLAIQLEEELLNKTKTAKLDTNIIEKALNTIKRYHAGVKRKSGEPFFTHPIAVALILLDYCKDQDAVIAALLHDTVEDTSLSITHIKAMFGEKVAFIVGKVTNLEDKIRRLSLEEHENIKRLINYEDERAAFVKLADRLHNMRTIEGHPSLSKQKHIANETLLFFVPLANQLGLDHVAQELEKLSLEVLAKK